jgi:DNA-binding response OmpR family regulator
MQTVLAVDDEPSIRRLLRISLEMRGYRVLEAADGATALRLARQERPDLAIIDVALPRLSGLDVCRLLHEDPASSRTAVLLLSGLLPPLESESLTRAGAQGWLAKPFTPADLLERVQSILSAPAALPRG